MALAWDEQCGITLSKMYPLVDAVKSGMVERGYGGSVEHIWTVLTCRARDFKQKKQFKKREKRVEYEILLDFYLIKNVAMEEKKSSIRQQMISITEETFGKYKFDDFDKPAFLSDFKEIVSAVVW